MCGSTGAGGPVVVEGSTIDLGPSNVSKIVIGGLGGACDLTLIGNSIFGKVVPGNAGSQSQLVMIDNIIADTAPFQTPNTSDAQDLRYTLINNRQVDQNAAFVARFPDRKGVVIGTTTQTDVYSIPDCSSSTVVPCAGVGNPTFTSTVISGSMSAVSYAASGILGVSCAANTTSQTTMVVTNGIVTHC